MSNDKTITIRITDHNGHTTLEQQIDEAVQTVIEQHYKFAKQPYVSSEYFQFTAVDSDDTEAILADAIRLKQVLEAAGDKPVITMAGDLVGGRVANSNCFIVTHIVFCLMD